MQRFDPGCSGNSCAQKSVDLAGDARGKPLGRIEAPDQAKHLQYDPTVKIARYTLYGTLGTAAFSAVAQVVVAWLQR